MFVKKHSLKFFCILLIGVHAHEQIAYTEHMCLKRQSYFLDFCGNVDIDSCICSSMRIRCYDKNMCSDEIMKSEYCIASDINVEFLDGVNWDKNCNKIRHSEITFLLVLFFIFFIVCAFCYLSVTPFGYNDVSQTSTGGSLNSTDITSPCIIFFGAIILIIGYYTIWDSYILFALAVGIIIVTPILIYVISYCIQNTIRT